MPLGKYYCDYCEKQFQDSPYARKRHLQGLQHLRAKALWYQKQSESQSQYQSFHDPISNPLTNPVCNRFAKTGFCHFGDNCKYFHPNSNSQNQIPQAVAASGMWWGNLPPSLQPPPGAGYSPLPFIDWG